MGGHRRASRSDHKPGPSRGLVWLSLLAASFGLVEAAVVIDLRALLYPDGFVFPLRLAEKHLMAMEMVREGATLFLLLGAAGLAAQHPWGRFGAFAYMFGLWDLVFYAGLKTALGWPAGLKTWDVLFLLPGVWTGPVWSAAGVAVLLMLCGAVIYRADARGNHPRPGVFGWAGGCLSFFCLLAAFLWNHAAVSRGEVPRVFPWWLWLAGVGTGLFTFDLLFRPFRPMEVASKPVADRR